VSERAAFLVGLWMGVRERLLAVLGRSEFDLRRRMETQAVLVVRTEAERIEIAPVGRAYQSQLGLRLVVGALIGLRESAVTYRPHSKSEARKLESLGIKTRRGHPVWQTPVVIDRAAPGQDYAAFDAFRAGMLQAQSPVTLALVRQTAEHAYLATRPADFNLRDYYA